MKAAVVHMDAVHMVAADTKVPKIKFNERIEFGPRV